MSRLPEPGADHGVWGTVLNEFLQVGHNNDGTLKMVGVSSGGTGATDAGTARTNLGAAADADVVHIAGTETITGAKSFSAPARFGSGTPWFDVTHPAFGATGTNYGDDGPAINAAITAANATGGGCVFLPAGTYRVTTQIVLKSTVVVMGLHPGSTIISWQGATGSDAVAGIGSAGTPRTSMALINLTIQGSTGSSSGKLVDIQHCQGLRIDNCYLIQQGTSVTDGAALFIGGKLNDVKVTRSVITSSAVYCFYHNSGQVTDDVTIDNCTFSSTYASTSTQAAVYLVSSGSGGRYTVSNCRIGPAPMTGITFSGPFVNPSVSNVKVLRVRGLGIELTNGVIRPTIRDVAVDYTGVTPLANAFGISLGNTTVGGGTQAALDGVLVNGVVGVNYGLELAGCNDFVISNFSILNCDIGAIVNNSCRVSLSNGVIDGCQTKGISVYGGASSGLAADDVTITGVVVRNFGQASSTPMGVAGIDIDAGAGSAKRCILSGVIVNGGAKPAGAAYMRGVSVNDTGFRWTGGQILNLTSADNVIGFFGTNVAASATVAGVGGFNPQGSVTPPAVTLNSEQINPFPYDVMVSVAGGAVTSIAFGASGATAATGFTSGAFFWPAGGYMKISGSAAPALVCYGL